MPWNRGEALRLLCLELHMERGFCESSPVGGQQDPCILSSESETRGDSPKHPSLDAFCDLLALEA